MKPPKNILDRLADCAEVCAEDFDGAVRREHIDGAHGPSSTTALLVTTTTGERYRITYEQVPA